jgi:hypothetical protein
LSGLPRGCKPPKLDLQELDFRVQAKLILLQSENFLVKGDAARGIFPQQQVFDLGTGRGLLGPESADFLFYVFNLS